MLTKELGFTSVKKLTLGTSKEVLIKASNCSLFLIPYVIQQTFEFGNHTALHTSAIGSFSIFSLKHRFCSFSIRTPIC